MSGAPAERPLYLGRSSLPRVFGTYHAPSADIEAGTAVVIVPPWGWDEVTTYRSRKAWAEDLAASGHATVRIDLPGAGDSAGSPTDPGLVEAWKAAVVDAAAWIRIESGARWVAVVGLGVGGLIAGSVLAEAAIEELVLWGTPTRGRTFLREQRAFGLLQGERYGTSDPSGLDDGSTEIGGFLLSAETSAAIGVLDLRTAAPGRVQRLLVLDRDGLPGDADLRVPFEANGVTVTTATGSGWAAMAFHPERFDPPLAVFEVVRTWLSDRVSVGAADPRPATVPPIAATGSLDLEVDGRAIRETPIEAGGLGETAFGIVSEPAVARRGEVCAVFLNAGAVRRIGPDRLWVEAARCWAARGLASCRVDVTGIGDAPGDAGMYRDVSTFYTGNQIEVVRRILDGLERRGYGPRFVLIGLCAGAYSSLQTAAQDARVIEAIAVNPRIVAWDPDLLERRDAMAVGELLGTRGWRRVLRRQVRRERVLIVGKAALRGAAGAVRRRITRLGRQARPGWVDEVEGRFDAVGRLGGRVVLAFSGDEPAFDEMVDAGVVERWGRSGGGPVSFRQLPGEDHTLRPLAAQAALHDLLDQELDRILGSRPVEGVVDDRPVARRSA